jgi:hypothetical protein
MHVIAHFDFAGVLAWTNRRPNISSAKTNRTIGVLGFSGFREFNATRSNEETMIMKGRFRYPDPR